jgi:hypothetical protein
MNVKFPDSQKLLIQMDKEDQEEVRGHYNQLLKLETEQQKKQLSEGLARRCHARAQKMMEIVREIGEPTLDKIGQDGSEAINLLTLHSYKEIMEKMLEIYTKLYSKDRSNFYYQAIPPLTDKLMILNERMQYFGTNWSVTKDGKFFLIQVKEFQSVNRRRLKYGLGPIKRPVILSVGAEKYPLGRGKAVASDQKKLTNEEYDDFVRYYKKALI